MINIQFLDSIMVWADNANIAKQFCKAGSTECVEILTKWHDIIVTSEVALEEHPPNLVEAFLADFTVANDCFKKVAHLIAKQSCREWFENTHPVWGAMLEGIAAKTKTFKDANKYMVDDIYPKFKQQCG